MPYHHILNEEFIAKIKGAIMEGQTLPRTKKFDIIIRVVASTHVFRHIATDPLQQHQPTSPAEEIEKETLLRTVEYIGWAES